MISPIVVPKFPEYTQQIACGDFYTILLSSQGLVYSSGENISGQLGDGTRLSTSYLKVIEEIAHIPMSFVAAGSFSAAISKESKSLYLWGTGAFGEFLTPHRVKKIKDETI